VHEAVPLRHVDLRYALGDEHPYREPCREIVHKATIGELRGEASVDLLQESRTSA